MFTRVNYRFAAMNMSTTSTVYAADTSVSARIFTQSRTILIDRSANTNTIHTNKEYYAIVLVILNMYYLTMSE